MGSSTADMINQLMAQTSVAPQPSFDGVSAPADPTQLQALLGKLRQQQENQNYNRPTEGEYGFLHDAGRQAFSNVGQSLGNLANKAMAPAAPQAPQGAPFSIPDQSAAPDASGAGTPPAPTPNPGATPQQSISNAVKAAQFYHRSLLQSGTPADQANLQTLTKMTEWGVPGASDKLAAAQEQVVKNAKLVAESGKDTAQGNAAQDEVRARGVDEANRARERDQADTRLGIEQQNADTEQNKANAQIKNMTPSGDAIQTMVDQKLTTGKDPVGLGRSGLAGAYYAALGARLAQTGDDFGAAAARQQGIHADAQSLSKLTATYDNTKAYVATMDKNLAKAKEAADKIDFGNATKLNDAYAAWLKGTSDPAYAVYNLYFDSVGNELAKIKSGSFGNTAISDSARKDNLEIMHNTIGTLGRNAVFDAVRTEGQNRVSSLGDQRQEIIDRIKGVKAPTAPAAPPATAAASPTSAAPGAVVDFNSLK